MRIMSGCRVLEFSFYFKFNSMVKKAGVYNYAEEYVDHRNLLRLA